MSFPKAKNKRFNEIMSCAPPVGSYDPKMLEKVPAALMDSKDERFKEPRPVDPHSSNLFSASSSASGHSFQASTPKKLSAASSTDSLAGDRSSVSGIPKRATSSSNIVAPVDLSKQKELERQIRVLVNERNELHRRLVLREEELQKVDSRLQIALKDRTSMMADLAVMEKERSDLRKGNEILKTKELNFDRLKQLQAEIVQLNDKLKKKEKEVAEMHDKLKIEMEEKKSAVVALTQTNVKLTEMNKELKKEIEDKSRQLRLLVGNGSAYEAEMNMLKNDISQLKSRNQKFIEDESSLVAQCNGMQMAFSHCLDLQKQVENLVTSVTQQTTDSSADMSEELRVQLELVIGLLKTSLDSCHLQNINAENLTGDLKVKVHELLEAAITDVGAIESVHRDLLSLFTKLMKCQQNEEALGQAVSMLTEKIKEHEDNLRIMTDKKNELQNLYEEALDSVRTEKERGEKIELTADGLQSERTFLETELRREKEASISLQEKLHGTKTEISQLNEMILTMEKLISCSTGDKEDLLRQNLRLETELKNVTEQQNRLEIELTQCAELSEVVQLKDANCKQLEEEKNELTTKLKAAETERELGQRALEESHEKSMSLELRYKLIESQLLEMSLTAEADRGKLVEELTETKHLLSCQQNHLDENETKMTELENERTCLQTQLIDCLADKDQLKQLRDLLELRLNECEATCHQLCADLEEAREQLLQRGEEHGKALLEMKTREEAETAKLAQATRQLEKVREDAAKKEEQLVESCEKLMILESRLKLVDSQLSEIRLQTETDRGKLVEELTETKHLLCCQQSYLDECRAKIIELENQKTCLETQLTICLVDKDQLLQLKDQLELRLNECEVTGRRLCAELEEAKGRVLKHEEMREQMLLEMKACKEAVIVTTADLDHATKQLNELKVDALKTKEQLDQVSSERDCLTEENRTMKTDLEKERWQSAEHEEQLTKHKEESVQLKERLSLDAEIIASLEKTQNLLEVEMDQKYRDLEETLSQRKVELEYSVEKLEAELSKSRDSLSNAERRLQESESTCISLSRELESVKAEQEGAENLVSRLQGEVQTVRLQMEHAEFARTELEVAKEYMKKDLSEMNDKLKESMEEIEKSQSRLDNTEAKNRRLNEDNVKNSIRIEDLEEALEKVQAEKNDLEGEHARQSVSRQELTQAYMMLSNNFNVTAGHLSEVQVEKERLSSELNCVHQQMTSLRHKNEELQLNVKKQESLLETNKHLEKEVLKCHEHIKRRHVEFETMSVQVKDLKQTALLVEKLKEKCHVLETDSAKESDHLRQSLEEEKRRVEVERHRQQEYRCNSDRLQIQLDAKTRELNESNDKNRRLHEQYSGQLTDMKRQHQNEMTELKRISEEKSLQPGDVALITEEAKRWREMYEDLWNKVQPFKEQLEAFEMEKRLLLGRSKNAQMEIEKLSHDYAKILGHQNQKQKIHHILKLKEENVTLKKEVEMLRDKDCKHKRQIGHLTEKLDALEGKRRFEPSKAFKPARENDMSTVLPLREGNR